MTKTRFDFPPHTAGDTLKGGWFEFWLAYDATSDTYSSPMNLTGFRADLQVRTAENPASPLILNLSTTNGGLTIGGTGNNFVFVNDVVASKMEVPPKTYKYDLQLTSPSGEVTTYFYGDFPIITQVTKV